MQGSCNAVRGSVHAPQGTSYASGSLTLAARHPSLRKWGLK